MIKVQALPKSTNGMEQELRVLVTRHEKIVRLSKSARCANDLSAIRIESEVSKASDTCIVNDSTPYM
jgi:hypothetical protein